MANKVFVSSNFNDRAVVNTINNMIARGRYYGDIFFVENDVSSEGAFAIDREINRIMNSCDAVLFVVGDNCHNSPWIEREVELAYSKNLPVIVTQLPKTFGGPPNGLKDKKYTVAKWEEGDLGEALYSS